MKIAYLCADPGIPVFGTKGASVHVQEVIRGFLNQGHTVSLYCARTGDQIPADLAHLKVTTQKIAKGPTALRERAIGLAASELAYAAANDGCDLVYERYSLFSDAGAEVSERTGAPLIVEVNAPLIDEQRQHRELVDEFAAHEATVRTFASAATVVCVSEQVRSWVHQLVSLDPARVRVIGNGVNTSRIRPGARTERPFTVGFIGTLKPWHGTDILIRAVAAAAQASERAWELTICGDGPQRERLTALTVELGIDHFTTFTGAIPPADVPEYLAGFDAAAAPYPAAEEDHHYFSPLKLYEYFAAGLPVVASAIGQIPSVLDHERTGLLVQPGNVEALAHALTRLCDDADLRTALGAAARHQAVARHDWNSVVRHMLDSVEIAQPVVGSAL